MGTLCLLMELHPMSTIAEDQMKAQRRRLYDERRQATRKAERFAPAPSPILSLFASSPEGAPLIGAVMRKNDQKAMGSSKKLPAEILLLVTNSSAQSQGELSFAFESRTYPASTHSCAGAMLCLGCFSLHLVSQDSTAARVQCADIPPHPELVLNSMAEYMKHQNLCERSPLRAELA